MAIKAGELIHVGNLVLIDRIQTGGPGNLNIPTERIYELGNYESVAVTRDIPDLTFSLESLDVSAELEALLTGSDFATDADGTVYQIAQSLPMDVVSQFKRGKNDADPFDVRGSVALPFLAMESLSYRFGLRDNAAQTVNLRGDSIFYAGASAFVQVATGSGAAGQDVVLANEPIPYNGDSVAGTRYALSVSLKSGKRLTLGSDYTEVLAAGVLTITITDAVPATDEIRVVYQSAVVAEYPQASHAAADATRPAAIKGKDIELRIGGFTITDRWSSVQSATVDYRVTLDRDEEFGNAQAVAQDYDVPEVSGNVEIKPRDYAELIGRIREISGVAGNEAIGPSQAVPLPMEILLHSPDSGDVLKTIEVPDARFTLPGYSGRVQQKLTVTFPFESDGGILSVIKGERV